MWGKKWRIAVEAALLIWFTLFTFAEGNLQSLWIDELSSIGYVRTGVSLWEMFETYLFVDTNLPLYSAFLYVWHRVVPYGEQFLLIPSILFCVGGICFLAAAARRIGGERAEFFTVCLGCGCGALIWQGAWEVRCYGLIFLLSAATLFAYVSKTLSESRKTLFLYGLTVAVFLWTHWFACILLAFYGLADFILMMRKKCSWKTLLCYLTGLSFFFLGLRSLS